MKEAKKEAKQVIVVRKDLGMSRGKMAAQVAHASLACILKMGHYENVLIEDRDVFVMNVDLYSALHEWLNGRFTKIVLAVENEEELLAIHELAITSGLHSVLITDAGLTEFACPTNTCVGIGPHYVEDFDKVTGTLKTFR